MMNGEATGKGLDIKGKSAKCGNLSGFLIPFLQIHRNDHKAMVLWPPSNGPGSRRRMRRRVVFSFVL